MRAQRLGLTVLVGLLSACTTFDGLTFAPDAGRGDATDEAASSSSPYVAAVLADRPLAYYRFEDADRPTARDETGRSDCEYIGAVQRGIPSAGPATGTAIGFEGAGDRHVVCQDLPFDFVGTLPFSLEAWVNPRTADAIYRKVLSKDDAEGARSGYNLSVVEPGVVRVERWGAGAEICGVTGSIRLDAWSHVVATFDGAALRLYVDGVVTRDECGGVQMPDTLAPLTFGVQADLRYGAFDGAFDELAVYDHVLTPDRVVAHRDAVR